MAEWRKSVVTEFGEKLLAESVNGDCTIEFVKVSIGCGTYAKEEMTDEYLRKQTDIRQVKNEYGISSVERKENVVTLNVLMNNASVKNGYDITELGLWAKRQDAGSDPELYSIILAEISDYFPDSSTPTTVNQAFQMVFASNDTKVEIAQNMGAYVLLDDFEKSMENFDKIKADETTMQEAIQAVYENANQFTLAKIAELINGAPATADTLKEIADLIADNKSVVDALDSAIGKKANQTELDTHTGNSTIHITASERTKWNNADNKLDKNYATVATGTNLNSVVTTGLYFCNSSYTYTNMPSGVVNGYLVVMRNGTTNNIKQVFYRQGTTGANDWQIYVRSGTTTSFGTWVRLITEKDTATASVAGLTKLYTSTGTSTDGTMTRQAITNSLAAYVKEEDGIGQCATFYPSTANSTSAIADSKNLILMPNALTAADGYLNFFKPQGSGISILKKGIYVIDVCVYLMTGFAVGDRVELFVTVGTSTSTLTEYTASRYINQAAQYESLIMPTISLALDPDVASKSLVNVLIRNITASRGSYQNNYRTRLTIRKVG